MTSDSVCQLSKGRPKAIVAPENLWAWTTFSSRLSTVHLMLIEHLLCVRHWSQHFPCISLLIAPKSPVQRGLFYYTHFTYRKTKAQKSRITGLGSHSHEVKEDVDPVCALNHCPTRPLSVTKLVIWWGGGGVRRQQSLLPDTSVSGRYGAERLLCLVAGPKKTLSGGRMNKVHWRGERTGDVEACVFLFRSDQDNLKIPPQMSA